METNTQTTEKPKKPVKLTKSGKPDRRCVSNLPGRIQLNGRAKGSKNKATIFKEIIKGNFETLFIERGQKIFEVLAEKAEAGDMQAIKIVMDRLVPTQRSVDMADLEKGSGLQISINIGSLEKQVNEPIDAEYTDAD